MITVKATLNKKKKKFRQQMLYLKAGFPLLFFFFDNSRPLEHNLNLIGQESDFIIEVNNF